MQNKRLLVINDAVVFEFIRRFNFLLEMLFIEILFSGIPNPPDVSKVKNAYHPHKITFPWGDLSSFKELKC